MKSEPVYNLTANYSFSSKKEMNEFQDYLRSLPLLDKSKPQPLNFCIRKTFTACKKCGVPANRHTLGSGVAGEPADECSSANARACIRRQERNLEDGISSEDYCN